MGRVKPQKKGEPPFVSRSCKLCNELDTVEMVLCDICSQCTHFSCAGVDASIADKPWLCRACEDQKKKAKESAEFVNSPKLLPSTSAATTPTTVADLEKKLATLQKDYNRLKKEARTDVEREKSLTTRADTNALEAMNAADNLRAELEKIRAANTRQQNEWAAKFAAATSEAEKSRQLYQQRQASVEIPSKEHSSQSTGQRAYTEVTEPPVASVNDDSLRNRRVPSDNEPLNVAIPAVERVESADAIAATVLAKLGPMICELVTKMVPGTKAPGQTDSHSAAINLSSPLSCDSNENRQVRNPHSVPVMKAVDSLANLSRYDDLFDKAERPSAYESHVEKLAVTLSRPLLAKLPDFDGKSAKSWPLFKSIYDTTTQQGQFTEIDNVNRLRLALKEPASRQVKSLLMYPSSVRGASAIMEELEEAFGKPELILKELTQELLELPRMKNKYDGKLRCLSTEMRNYVASLDEMKMSSELNNGYVLVQMEEKLDFDHQREWHKQQSELPNSKDRNSLRLFSEFMQARVRELPVSSYTSSSTQRGCEPEKKRSRINTHQQANKEVNRAGSTRSLSCFKCNGSHAMLLCPEFKKLTPRDRSRFVLENRICTSCLKSKGHSVKDCRVKKPCGIDECTYSHNPLLHYAKSNRSYNQAAPLEVTTNSSATASGDNNTHSLSAQANTFTPNITTAEVSSRQLQLIHEGSGTVLFKILPVRIYGEQGLFVDTYAFLDDGSSLTLIEKEVYEALHLKGVDEQLCLQWTKGITRTENSFRTSLTISGMKDYVKGKPKILIGLQHANLLVNKNSHSAGDADPIAVKTQLGWTVFGNHAQTIGLVALTSHRKSGVQLSIHQIKKGDEELHKLVKGYFSTENFGVMPPERDLISAENERALSIMKKTLKKVDSRYELGLLWKSDDVKLPDSYSMALKRLITLERSLRKKPELLKWKNNHVKELLAKGYARKATPEELKKQWPRIWYCPTFIVVNPNKIPSKPRDVADVAACVDGKSLNSNLLKGPDNMAPLLQGLCRFRENAVAVNADVKEMFHQIGIKEEDQQCQRFLYRDCDDSQAPTVYIMQRMMFGPTCSPSCAQYVKNYHARKFLDTMPGAATALINYTYVDDYFNSHASVEEALTVTRDAFKICNTMGFNLLGVQSNRLDLLEQLPEDKVKTTLVSIEAQETEYYVTKVLGMYWLSFPDYFTFKMCQDELVDKMLSFNFAPSKREILRTLMRIFDPLGLIAIYLIRGKIVLQEIWREGTNWDEPIPSCLVTLWQEFIRELPNIENLRIPRRYATLPVEETIIDLIVFVDASEQAFAATAYFRFERKDEVEVAHVMAKAKVAPIKRLTIPQLELQAAVLGVRLAKSVEKLHSFKFRSIRYLSDSQVVLSWICSKKYNFKTFVAARIGEILEGSSRKEWFHVRSKDNVADDATKWSDPHMGDNDTRWFKGPLFLQDDISSWPVKPAVECEEEDEIVKLTKLSFIHLFNRNISIELNTIDSIAPRFKSQWLSLTRVVAYMLRFRSIGLDKLKANSKFITPEEICRAEEAIFQKIQHDSFPDEVRALESGEPTVSRASKILKLCPLMRNGVIRMSSRSQKANMSYAAKCPAILPNKHELVDVLIKYHHEKNFHLGKEMTIADIRSSAWIIDISAAVGRVKRKCQLCKNLSAKPIMPLMGELPAARVDFGCKPFTHVGLDAFGPYHVKYGRGSVKRYGLIFTCLTYRAVHLEVMNDMSTEACLMAIRRFLVRRGWSKHFYSDNGKNFVGSKNSLHEEMKLLKDALGENVANKFEIHWHFQPAYSPWWGGAWERLIQSVKRCIDFLMHEETPREDIFLNAIMEAEFWMNRRPLTHCPLDHEDSEPLTPNAVLFGSDQEELAAMIGVFNVNDAFSRKAHHRTQHLVQKLISRWTKEYLPSINRRSKWYERTKPVKIDDIVILTDPSEPKKSWKKGRVVKLYPGADGVVRAVDVQFADKTVKTNRPVGRIAVLDVNLPNLNGCSDGARYVACAESQPASS